MAISGPKLIMEDARPPVKVADIKPPQPRQVDDDWFVLLDAAARSPGILPFYVPLLLLDGIRQNNMVSAVYFTLVRRCLVKICVCVSRISGCG